jgi:COMPASS component SPP1
VTFQPEPLAEDIQPESKANPSPVPGATALPKRGRGRLRKTPQSAGPLRAEDPSIYCTCHKPDDGKLMIQCDWCDGWLHGQCVGVAVEEAQRMDEYVCPSCSTLSISPCRKGKPGTQEEASQVRTPRDGGRSGFQGNLKE